MEMVIGSGKGYVSADLNKPEEPPLGLIPMTHFLVQLKKYHTQLVLLEKEKH